MNPLSASSLNTERARVDVGRPNAAGADAAGGGFAQLLQGARDTPQAAPATAQPPVRQDETRAQQRTAEAPHDEADAGPEVKEEGEAERAAADRHHETGPTLAHWLLHGGQQAPDTATPAAVPPAQQPGVPTDDLKAAALARQVLEAVRQRAKGAAGGKADAAAAAPLSATEPAARRELAHAEPKGVDLAAGAGAADTPKETTKAAQGDSGFADVLNQMQAATPTPAGAAGSPDAAATPPAERLVHTPVQDAGFGAAVGVSISRLAKEGVHEARLQLNPAELGPVSVHIQMQGQEARLSLGAAQAETRALLDASLPALTEAFRADGLVLAASQVGELSPEQGAFAGQAGQGDGARDGWAQAREGAGGQGGGGQRGQGRGEPARSTELLMPLPGSGARPGRSATGGLDLYA